ncbi:MAG: FG-GAP repeat protein [Verrucomicrobiae bacterium]|nr:FG-GAP repeat protein [Verrucomicrobiae bacterium]
MKSLRTSLVPVLILWLALGTISSAVFALEPTFTKIHPKSLSNPNYSQFGNAVAATDRYLVVAAENNEDLVTNGGVVQVFDARNGRFLRQIRPDDLTAGDHFGWSIAACGNLVAIGSPYADDGSDVPGAVYVYDLRNGRLLHKLVSPDHAILDEFGYSVAMEGNRILVGAAKHSTPSSNCGALYLFDATTGALISKLSASDATDFQRLGWSVDLCGGLAIGGAPGSSGAVTQGAVYVFDVLDPGPAITEVKKLTLPSPTTQDYLGASVKLAGQLVVAGAPGDDDVKPDGGQVHVFDAAAGTWLRAFAPADLEDDDDFGRALATRGDFVWVGGEVANGYQGAAYLFRLSDGAQLAALDAADSINNRFGYSVAWCGESLLMGARFDDDVDTNAGAAYWIRPVAAPLPLDSVAKVRDYAPGAVEANFARFGAACLNVDGAVTFDARLSGRGAGGGKNSGFWSEITNSPGIGPLQLSAQRGDLLAPLTGIAMPDRKITPSGSPISNQQANAVFQVTASGEGVTRASNRFLLAEKGSANLQLLIRTGITNTLTGDPVSKLLEVTQSHSNGSGVAFAYQLQRGGAIGAGNDSGVISLLGNGTTNVEFREGNPAPGVGGFTFGQFLGRVSHGANGDMVFTCYVTNGGPPVQRAHRNGSAYLTQGDLPLGGSGPEVRAIVTELAGSVFSPSITRATLTGAGANRSNNEYIYSEFKGGIARKGEQIPGEATGVLFNRFLGFWPVGLDRVILLVKRSGPGIGRRNDCALYLCQEDNSFLKLMTEGDAVCDCDCPTVGAIQRVEVDPVGGDYVILTSLVGGNRRHNQALFRGDAGLGNATTDRVFRLPHLRLRKGANFTSPVGGQASAIRSMTFIESKDRGGAGGKGLAQSINNAGQIAVCVTFDDRSKELLTGKP